ncbi:MAG: SDR family NAD(P)-dependent oxidoreductase [candidate division Zixibacteria bacterium]|nr:SDR family NAD(P)-dependent oxidoreductase [candidate division Zixibacteria bacterium]
MSSLPSSVLITGANGFVGARLCRAFIERGFRVVAGVRESASLTTLEKLEVEYRKGDVTQPETLREMVAGVDYVVHNAGVVKARHKDTFFEVNERGTRSLMEEVAKNNPDVKKVIYISSLAAAGPAIEGRPVTEDDQPRPISIYGESKLAGEKAALSYAEQLNVISIRPPGVYGPGDREIFSFFNIVNKGIRPLIGNINRKLQLVHVDDLCRGICLATTGETVSGESYFIAENQSYTMKDLVDILARAAGRKGIALRLPGALFKLIAVISEFTFKAVGATPMLTREKARELHTSWEVSTSKARGAFGFESEIPFEQGARETYKWYRREGWLK